MNETWNSRALIEPFAGPSPCGVSLDPAELLAFDNYRVFGQPARLDAPLESGEQGRTPKPVNSPEWQEIRDRALAALTTSKDLRVLTLLGAALLRIEGPYAFCQTATVASSWLTNFWDTVYPLAPEDTIERQSALSGFGDQFAVVDGLRRAPLVSSRQHGHFSLRDIEQAAGQGPIDAAFDELTLGELQRSRHSVLDAVQAFTRIDARMREADADASLSFELVSKQLAKLDGVLQAQLARRPESGVHAEDGRDGAGDGGTGPLTAGGGGAIRTRQDAVRALDAVVAYFQRTEPSSPVPLLLERAKRLVSKNFLEVLADLAPGALGEARAASGVKGQG